MILLAILGFVVLLIFSSIFNGYALSVLWGWFVVPTFHLPTLSLVQAIGLAMILTYLTYQHVDAKKGDESFGEMMAKAFPLTLIRPSFALLFGYVLHKFM